VIMYLGTWAFPGFLFYYYLGSVGVILLKMFTLHGYLKRDIERKYIFKRGNK